MTHFDNFEITPPVKNLLLHIKTGDIDGEVKRLVVLDKELAENKKNFDTALKNKHANRYGNILPSTNTLLLTIDESTIVKLPNSDRYINANHIHGQTHGIKRSYIATQGPLEHTILDFWLMVYEFQSPVVVMLAKCVEDDKQKCHKYWPTEKCKLILADNFDAMDILHVSEEPHKEKSALSVRHIELTRRDRKNNDIIGKHSVKIVHFQGWPDFGVPDVSSFRALMDMIDGYAKSDVSDPIVVHCSAGVGRTGTYCAIDIICNQMTSSKDLSNFEFDLFGTVKKLKLARQGMVQTKEQYLYCYKVLAEEAMKRGIKFDL